MFNAQLDLVAVPQTGANVIPEAARPSKPRSDKPAKLLNIKPRTTRKYEPLETDGPATCLVWFD